MLVLRKKLYDDVIEARALHSNSIESRPMFTFCLLSIYLLLN